jgi:Ser/Thr protein kinase RdoA (MazF antagonist)
MLLHLAGSGVPVSSPVADRNGAFLHERFFDGTIHFACVFHEAPGLSYAELPPGSDSWFLTEAGRTLARIHNALDDPACSGWTRFHWSEDLWSQFAVYVPEREQAAWGLFARLQRELSGLPSGAPGFGLVHGDFTIMNLRAADGRVTAFDFDAACRHWRAHDLACFLHYFGARSESDRMLAYDRFLAGYSALRALGSDVVGQIPLFGQMRLLYSFLVFAKEWGFEDLSPDQQAYFDVRRRLFAQPPTWPGARGSLE